MKDFVFSGRSEIFFKASYCNSIEKIIDKLDTKIKLKFLSTVYPWAGQTCIKILSEPLSQPVNECIVNEGLFTDAEKIACITPAFKKEDRLD